MNEKAEYVPTTMPRNRDDEPKDGHGDRKSLKQLN